MSPYVLLQVLLLVASLLLVLLLLPSFSCTIFPHLHQQQIGLAVIAAPADTAAAAASAASEQQF